jgi:phage/plasmid-like protein (TIGR03299 family)
MENDSLVQANEKSWHGLGTVIDHAMTPEEALRITGHGWEVGMTPLSHTLPDGSVEDIEGFAACTRLDTKEVFGVFSKYQPIQNAEVYDLAYTLGDEVLVESAGTLFNGRKLFITIKGDSFTIGNGDKIDRFLVLANSHDGTLALSALPISFRVICNNTLNMALKQGSKKGWNIKHTANAQTKISEMQKALTRFKATGTFFEEQANALANATLNKKKLLAFFTDCYDNIVGSPINERQELDAEEAIQTWFATLESERVIFNTDVTLWGATNAITDWSQHRNPGRIQEGWQEKRMFNNLFGTISDTSVNVMNMALATI